MAGIKIVCVCVRVCVCVCVCALVCGFLNTLGALTFYDDGFF